ncbi:hypothetical protein ACTFIR_001394 [Dictyostelium discoideum]
MKQIIFILLLILFVFCFCKIKSENSIIDIYDISNKKVDTYTRYPSDTYETQCDFVFFLLLVDTSNSGQEFNVYTIDFEPSINFTPLFANATAQVIGVTVYHVFAGNYSPTIFTSFSNDSLINSSISINYSCQLIDLQTLNYTVFTYNNNSTSNSIFSMGAVFFFNVKSPIQSIYTPYNNNSFTSAFGQGMSFFAIYSKINFNEYNSLNILFWDGNYLNITYPQVNYKNSNNKNTQIITYPSKIDSFVQYGVNTYPLYKFTSNATNKNPFIYSVGQSSSVELPVPIYQSKNGDLTYLGKLYEFYPSNVTVFCQYDDKILPIFNITYNMTELPLYISGKFNITYTPPNETNLVNTFIFTSFGNSTRKYDYTMIRCITEQIQKIFYFPFGFKHGTNFNFKTKVSFLQQLKSSNLDNIYSFQNNIFNIPPNQYINSTGEKPEILFFEMVHLVDCNFLIRIKMKDFFYIYIHNDVGYKVIGFESLVRMENDVGLYEFVYDYKTNQFVGLDVYDTLGRSRKYNVGDFISLNPITTINPSHQKLNSYFIHNVSFLLNDIDVTNKSVDNILFFNYDGIDTNTPIIFILSDYVSLVYQIDNITYGTWNSTISKFQIEFTVPANTQLGFFPWVFMIGNGVPLISEVLPDSYQLRIKSTYFDAYGPIFENVIKINNGNYIGFRFVISDPINGFSKGKIVVRGEMDGSIYTFNLNENHIIKGDIYMGEYEINITLSSVCASQYYLITDVELWDRSLNLNQFSTWKPVNLLTNPFINYLNDYEINRIYRQCIGVNDGIDESPPVLLSFEANRTVNSDGSQIITFNFQVFDEDTGLKDEQFPTVYITTGYLRVIEGKSKLLYKNNSTANFTCNIEIPYAFGYKQDIIFSVYGFINNGGYFSGYSTECLKNNSFIYSIPDLPIVERLFIEGTTKITSTGNKLWIMGTKFGPNQLVHIKYYSDKEFSQISQPTKVYGVTMLIEDIKPTDKPFIIKIVDSSPLVIYNKESNGFVVTPKVFKYPPTIFPTLSPIPTNKPQKCIGEPECGGINQGYCSQSGCICYQPWVGIDCGSQVIIIPQPSTNTSTPTVEIPIIPGNNNNTNNNNQTTNYYIFKSLISIVSLRELDFQSKQIKSFTFEKWIFTTITNSKSKYEATILNENITTTITVNIEWFKDSTNISFANSQMTIDASSVKYTIEISEYKFSNSLNQLQLVMSASFETDNNNDICSLTKFGDSSNDDNSNYFKIQIDDHSLYGRFIKRAIIDNYVRSIDNVLLDSSMETIKTPSTSQSFIGITIPNYKQSIIVDPDFSVLIDSKSVSNDEENSICESKSKLTTTQLIGIIIGSVGFAAVIIFSITYFVIKKHRESRFTKSFDKKLKKLGEKK